MPVLRRTRLFQSTLPRRERHAANARRFSLSTFQSTLPRRERREVAIHEDHKHRFQSTLPRRERRDWRRMSARILAFQSTLPRRERHRRHQGQHHVAYFNPRSPEGSDLAYSSPVWMDALFQSTLPRRERRTSIQTARAKACISIHAPAKGATRHHVQLGCRVGNFNPRSREGSDREPRTGGYSKRDFNPRSREGSDQLRWHGLQTGRISIHAPAKGATRYAGRILNCFRFQSTLPRRERHEAEGILIYDPISIHAPAKGATVGHARLAAEGGISIHAPAKGATVGKRLLWAREAISIHAPAKGATIPCWIVHVKIVISIHAPAKGATS